MPDLVLTRRVLLLGGTAAALGGCSALSTLDAAATPLDTYDLSPAPAPKGPGRRRTLVVARPQATAALDSDRIMVKPDALSITYLPEARWSDALPVVVQSLLIRSISDSGRVAYAGKSEGGPVADVALLTRLDAFHATAEPDGALRVRVDMALTLLDDRTQRVIASRRFAGDGPAADDSPKAVVGAFQRVLDEVLPQAAGWAAGG